MVVTFDHAPAYGCIQQTEGGFFQLQLKMGGGTSLLAVSMNGSRSSVIFVRF